MAKSNYPFLARNQRSEIEEKDREIESLKHRLDIMSRGISGVPMDIKMNPGMSQLKISMTGNGENGVLEPSNPVQMRQSNRGPVMIHEGEATIEHPSGRVDVVKQEKLRALEKENKIPGFQNEGTFMTEPLNNPSRMLETNMIQPQAPAPSKQQSATVPQMIQPQAPAPSKQQSATVPQMIQPQAKELRKKPPETFADFRRYGDEVTSQITRGFGEGVKEAPLADEFNAYKTIRAPSELPDHLRPYDIEDAGVGLDQYTNAYNELVSMGVAPKDQYDVISYANWKKDPETTIPENLIPENFAEYGIGLDEYLNAIDVMNQRGVRPESAEDVIGYAKWEGIKNSKLIPENVLPSYDQMQKMGITPEQFKNAWDRLKDDGITPTTTDAVLGAIPGYSPEEVPDEPQDAEDGEGTSEFDRSMQTLSQFAAGTSDIDTQIREAERERLAGERGAATEALQQRLAQAGITGRGALTEEARLRRDLGAKESQIMGMLREGQADRAFQAASQLPGMYLGREQFEESKRQFDENLSFMKEKYGDTEGSRMAADAMSGMGWDTFRGKYPDATYEDYKGMKELMRQNIEAGNIALDVQRNNAIKALIMDGKELSEIQKDYPSLTDKQYRYLRSQADVETKLRDIGLDAAVRADVVDRISKGYKFDSVKEDMMAGGVSESEAREAFNYIQRNLPENAARIDNAFDDFIGYMNRMVSSNPDYVSDEGSKTDEGWKTDPAALTRIENLWKYYGNDGEFDITKPAHEAWASSQIASALITKEEAAINKIKASPYWDHLSPEEKTAQETLFREILKLKFTEGYKLGTNEDNSYFVTDVEGNVVSGEKQQGAEFVVSDEDVSDALTELMAAGVTTTHGRVREFMEENGRRPEVKDFQTWDEDTPDIDSIKDFLEGSEVIALPSKELNYLNRIAKANEMFEIEPENMTSEQRDLLNVLPYNVRSFVPSPDTSFSTKRTAGSMDSSGGVHTLGVKYDDDIYRLRIDKQQRPGTDKTQWVEDNKDLKDWGRYFEFTPQMIARLKSIKPGDYVLIDGVPYQAAENPYAPEAVTIRQYDSKGNEVTAVADGIRVVGPDGKIVVKDLGAEITQWRD